MNFTASLTRKPVSSINQEPKRLAVLRVARRAAVQAFGGFQNERNLFLGVWLLLLVDGFMAFNLVDKRFGDPTASISITEEMRELGKACALGCPRKPGEAVGFEILQEIDVQLADKELVLAMREILQPSEQQFVLGKCLRLYVVPAVEIARDAVISFGPWTVSSLLLAPMERSFASAAAQSRRPSALTRILLRVGASGQPDRAVAVLEIFLLVGFEPELVNPAIDGMSTIHG